MAFTRARSEEERIPKKKESTAPESLQQTPRKKSTGPKHDSLCIETYQENHALLVVDKTKGKTLLDQSSEDVPALSRCYCNCAACWLPTGRARTTKTSKVEGRLTGRCICKSCACWQDTLRNQTINSPTPSTRHTSSFKRSS